MSLYTKTIEIEAKSNAEAEEIITAMSDIFDITRQKASTASFLDMIAKLRITPSKILMAKAYFGA